MKQISERYSLSAPVPSLKLTCSEQQVLIFVRLQASALIQDVKLTCSVLSMALISVKLLVAVKLPVSEL